ncbi:MAG: indole-3-glycerol phosphate synthase TrpC [Burkholderiales bacterium]|uniref:indole-3-glycerol-phosphate synthase n=1 Tax=mine drainage metagenome TaxID=410659 RepID=E6PKS0_9ZZZZ|nr:indole-3-glycerol phosphate synthase TrpC [Burkholderiales bacterium]
MSILQKIREKKIEEIIEAKRLRPRAALEAAVRGQTPPRNFTRAIANHYFEGSLALIAEMKKASPSKGLLRKDFDVRRIAQSYRDGGAACLSVLTDRTFFQGNPEFVQMAKGEVDLPVLRKDFLIDPYQVVESRAMHADCILIILAMVDEVLAHELEAAAIELGLHVLIEIHDERELARAMGMKSQLIGINNRDLATFEADLTTSIRLFALFEPGRLAISESGISGPSDVHRLADAGIHAFLIGESLLKVDNIEKITRELLVPR